LVVAKTHVLRVIVSGLAFLLSLVVTSTVRSAKWRTLLLVIASYVFYFCWGGWFAGLLLLSTVANYVLGIWVRKTQSKVALAAGVSFNLLLLGSFKYLPPVAIVVPFASLQKFAGLALPLGLSFWTFQALSYLFDLYREEELDPSLLEFALYMAFFPVVISGPICRMPDMLPQFRCAQLPERSGQVQGLRRIAVGVLMMQLARLLDHGILAGDGVKSGFDHVARWGGADAWILAFGFGLQLFLDFGGYSHIAIGAAKMLGLTVPENFARPFSSSTPSIFWTRWHMSLSFWIRDYVFLPLAMLRRELWWRNGMLVVSMILFGVWHKAALLFVLWGCYHGALLVLHRQVQQLQQRFGWAPPARIWDALSWITTISLVSLGWILFRANSLLQARQMFSAVLSPRSYGERSLSGSFYALVIGIALGYVIVVRVNDLLDRACQSDSLNTGVVNLIARNRWYWLTPLYAIALFFVLMVTLTQGGTAAQMMYRQF
jgi:alginate O-acetyltransferase complex protein AlgI